MDGGGEFDHQFFLDHFSYCADTYDGVCLNESRNHRVHSRAGAGTGSAADSGECDFTRLDYDRSPAQAIRYAASQKIDSALAVRSRFDSTGGDCGDCALSGQRRLFIPARDGNSRRWRHEPAVSCRLVEKGHRKMEIGTSGLIKDWFPGAE